MKFLTTDVMRSFNSTNMADDNYNTSQSNLEQQRQDSAPLEQQRPPSAARSDSLGHDDEGGLGRGQQQASGRSTRIADEMSQDLQYLSREAPLDGGESTFGAYSTLGGAGGPTTTTQQHTYTSTITRTSSIGQRPGEAENDYERTDFRLDGDENGAIGTNIDPARAEQQLRQSSQALEQMAPDNVDIQRGPLQQAG